MAKIQLKKNYISIPFEDNGETILELKFYITDDSLLELQKRIDNLAVEYNKTDKNELKQNEKMKSETKDAYEFIFGEGTYEELYKLNPSSVVLTYYLFEITNIIMDEMSKLIDSSQLDKYFLTGQLGNAKSDITVE